MLSFSKYAYFGNLLQCLSVIISCFLYIFCYRTKYLCFSFVSNRLFVFCYIPWNLLYRVKLENLASIKAKKLGTLPQGARLPLPVSVVWNWKPPEHFICCQSQIWGFDLVLFLPKQPLQKERERRGRERESLSSVICEEASSLRSWWEEKWGWGKEERRKTLPWESRLRGLNGLRTRPPLWPSPGYQNKRTQRHTNHHMG